MPRGLIQHAHHAKYERKNRLQNLFNEYVLGFMDHAFEIVRTCPECRKKEMSALKVWREKTGVFGIWKCRSCGHEERKEVPIADIVNDFNTARKGEDFVHA